MPKGVYDINVNYIQDGNYQSTSFTQTDQGALGSFVLGTTVLGGTTFESIVRDDVQGEFRNMILQILQGGLNEDAEIQSLGITITGAGMSGE